LSPGDMMFLLAGGSVIHPDLCLDSSDTPPTQGSCCPVTSGCFVLVLMGFLPKYPLEGVQPIPTLKGQGRLVPLAQPESPPASLPEEFTLTSAQDQFLPEVVLRNEAPRRHRELALASSPPLSP
jgi:hypothetical protein